MSDKPNEEQTEAQVHEMVLSTVPVLLDRLVERGFSLAECVELSEKAKNLEGLEGLDLPSFFVPLQTRLNEEAKRRLAAAS